MTKSFKKQAAQGDVLFTRIEHVPDDAIKATEENGHFIVAHSETGHHHVIDSCNAQLLIDKTNNFISYIKVSKPVEVEHERSFDTHESIMLSPGNYQVRRQREYVPEGFRRVAD